METEAENGYPTPGKDGATGPYYTSFPMSPAARYEVSSMVEHVLCMHQDPDSIPSISNEQKNRILVSVVQQCVSVQGSFQVFIKLEAFKDPAQKIDTRTSLPSQKYMLFVKHYWGKTHSRICQL